MTDGAVINPQNCIDMVRSNANTTRVFTFGIGRSASRVLCDGVAKAGEGEAVYIDKKEDMPELVITQLRYAMKPALTDVKLNWGTLKNVGQSPFRAPPLFLDNKIVFYGFLTEEMKEPTTITLKAETAIQQFEFSVTIDPKSLQKGDLPHKLGAKSLIRDLEEGRSYMHKDDKSLIQGKTENDVKNEIIRLSTSYGVISKYTAFIAIEDSVNIEDEKKRV